MSPPKDVAEHFYELLTDVEARNCFYPHERIGRRPKKEEKGFTSITLKTDFKNYFLIF